MDFLEELKNESDRILLEMYQKEQDTDHDELEILGKHNALRALLERDDFLRELVAETKLRIVNLENEIKEWRRDGNSE